MITKNSPAWNWFEWAINTLMIPLSIGIFLSSVFAFFIPYIFEPVITVTNIGFSAMTIFVAIVMRRRVTHEVNRDGKLSLVLGIIMFIILPLDLLPDTHFYLAQPFFSPMLLLHRWVIYFTVPDSIQHKQQTEC